MGGQPKREFGLSLPDIRPNRKYAHLSEQEKLHQTELDIVLSAVNTYLNVLLKKTSLEQERYNLEITRENYHLSKNRVTVGSTNASDLFRWESELANAKKNVLVAQSNLEKQRQALNCILNRPISEPFSTAVETLDNPQLLISDQDVARLVTNPESLARLTAFLVKTGIDQAPELKQLNAQICAYQRQYESDQRAFWLPNLNLTGGYTRNFDETRASSGIAAPENDWSVGIELSLPLYEGGAKSARRTQSILAISRLKTQILNTQNSVEQEVRSATETAYASCASIDLAKQSERASQKNYDLVAQAYAQGRDSIVDLLDARDALLRAKESSMNAVYAFLVDLMNLQRATGRFDFFFTDKDRMAFIKKATAYMTQQNKAEGSDK